MRTFLIAAVLTAVAVPAWAQSSGNAPVAPSMTSSATTMAPVAPGSRVMHAVPTPAVEKKSPNQGGTSQKLTGKGGN